MTAGALAYLDQRIYGRRACFLCGRLLFDDFSEEHVFPRWLQKRFHLWNRSLQLTNRTRIRYRQLPDLDDFGRREED